MKQFYSITLILAYLVVLARPVAPWVEYSFNKKTIAAEWCVQKEVVNNCCQGKCYLSTKIKANNGATPNAPENNLHEDAETLYHLPKMQVESLAKVSPRQVHALHSALMLGAAEPQPLTPPPKTMFS